MFATLTLASCASRPVASSHSPAQDDDYALVKEVARMTMLVHQTRGARPSAVIELELRADDEKVQRALRELAKEGLCLEYAGEDKTADTLHIAPNGVVRQTGDRNYRAVVRTGARGAVHHIAILRQDSTGDWRVIQFLQQMIS